MNIDGFRSVSPHLLKIGSKRSPERIDDGSRSTRLHNHRKALDEVHLSGKEIARKYSQTLLFRSGLKMRKPWVNDRKGRKGLQNLS